jgi:hypothetical protein
MSLNVKTRPRVTLHFLSPSFSVLFTFWSVFYWSNVRFVIVFFLSIFFPSRNLEAHHVTLFDKAASLGRDRQPCNLRLPYLIIRTMMLWAYMGAFVEVLSIQLSHETRFLTTSFFAHDDLYFFPFFKYKMFQIYRIMKRFGQASIAPRRVVKSCSILQIRIAANGWRLWYDIGPISLTLAPVLHLHHDAPSFYFLLPRQTCLKKGGTDYVYVALFETRKSTVYSFLMRVWYSHFSDINLSSGAIPTIELWANSSNVLRKKNIFQVHPKAQALVG